ncbi:hypothetical protein [Tepidanaerobacter syntrophicus]|uniref:hypothetical protein n=1 Tax=Tepidanaerobacter syntrophicus TaxID=224999 RepID=UPI001BD636A1|nr:hypothetical protein [Tepidanaerobacter syntrophicus]
MITHTEQINCDLVSIRLDVYSATPVEKILEDTTFLNYRLAGVTRQTFSELPAADFIWYKDEKEKTISYEDEAVKLTGQWFEGEIQRILVSLIAKKLFQKGRYLFHSSAVNYKQKNILFISGESNRGKSMSQIATCKKGATIISTETTILDWDGNVIMGSKKVYLRERAKGTERVDKPSQDEGVVKFFGKDPEYKLYEGNANIDLIVVPDMDGNYSTFSDFMSDYEKEYQTFHCLCDYLGMHILLSSGLPMPLFDTQELRKKRANFIANFAKNRPYIYIRCANPEIFIDELEKYI